MFLSQLNFLKYRSNELYLDTGATDTFSSSWVGNCTSTLSSICDSDSLLPCLLSTCGAGFKHGSIIAFKLNFVGVVFAFPSETKVCFSACYSIFDLVDAKLIYPSVNCTGLNGESLLNPYFNNEPSFFTFSLTGLTLPTLSYSFSILLSSRSRSLSSFSFNFCSSRLFLS